MSLSEVPNPWKSISAASLELADKHQPVDYSKIVGHSDVLLLGQADCNRPLVMAHLGNSASALVDAGIGHLVIEALNAGTEPGQLDLSLVLESNDHFSAIRQFLDAGLTVTPVDLTSIRQSAANPVDYRGIVRIKTCLARGISEGKKTALIVDGNQIKQPITPATETVLSKVSGLGEGLTTVRFVGGYETTPTRVVTAARRAGIDSQEFMLDMKPYAALDQAPFGVGSLNYLVHLPQQQSRR